MSLGCDRDGLSIESSFRFDLPCPYRFRNQVRRLGGGIFAWYNVALFAQLSNIATYTSLTTDKMRLEVRATESYETAATL
jgi:hypothetical protein